MISVIGEGYSRPVIEGTTSEVLDTFGLGHYPGTAMPGDEGNFAVAGHRQTNGAVLDHIDALTEGERIHVRTADGYYTYLYSETLIVLPTQTDEIAPVPGEPGEPADGGCMTLTSCNPRFGDTERIIVHAQLESWRPNSAGPPRDRRRRPARRRRTMRQESSCTPGSSAAWPAPSRSRRCSPSS
ncbi:sortase [Kocuria palustris]|uniref:sortase n=1 Tax=Kocuria palustris TaxID=71999 RepID=UPI002468ED12|nr:sortase [Kocuria palustris]MDH5152881.1 sortase [Kocuria palustris]